MTYIAITADYAKLRKVRRALRLKGVEAYLPAIVHHRPVVKSAKIRYRRRVTPLMSYILARAPDHPAARDLWLYDVLQTKGVRGYVKFIDRPALIDEKHIADLKAAVAQTIAKGTQAFGDPELERAIIRSDVAVPLVRVRENGVPVSAAKGGVNAGPEMSELAKAMAGMDKQR